MRHFPFTQEEIYQWPEGSKGCLKCRDIKEFYAFTKNNQGRFGYHSVCKECRKPISKLEQANRSQEYILHKNAKARAKRDNLCFDISVEDIVIPTYCPILGVLLTRNENRNNSASLDKIIPALGYIKGNIAVISNRANRIKNDATPEELLKLAAWSAEVTKVSMYAEIKPLREFIDQVRNTLGKD